jgi:hypothetical protein
MSFGEESTRTDQPNFPPQCFLTKVILTARMSRQRQKKQWAGLKMDLKKFSTWFFVRQTFPPNSQLRVLDLSVLNARADLQFLPRPVFWAVGSDKERAWFIHFWTYMIKSLQNELLESNRLYEESGKRAKSTTFIDLNKAHQVLEQGIVEKQAHLDEATQKYNNICQELEKAHIKIDRVLCWKGLNCCWMTLMN